MNSMNLGAKCICAALLVAGIVGCGSNGSEPDQRNVPEGAWSTHQTVTSRHAPPGYNAVVAWAQAATMSKTQAGVPAKIEIDYMRLVEDDPISGVSVLSEEHYDSAFPQVLSMNQGALYDRSPYWFANDDHHVLMANSTLENSLLTIDVSQTPDNIAHWWTNRALCKPSATYYVEMRVRITGQVGLQLGGDFWATLTSPWAGYNVNNREYFASDWYGDTNGEFVVIRVPKF